MPSSLERHYYPHDAPNGSAYDAVSHNGDDIHHGPPETDDSIDQPAELPEPDDQPEGHQPAVQPQAAAGRGEGGERQTFEQAAQHMEVAEVSLTTNSYPYVVGGWGLPLDRLSAETKGAGSGHADGEAEGGSGETFWYTLDRNVQIGPGETDQRYMIHVQTPEGENHMLAQADVAEQAASFTLNTKTDDGTSAADFDDASFVASSLNTFRNWGCAIQHVDLRLWPNTTEADFTQFQEVKDSDLVETIQDVSSAQILHSLGFTEIQHITVDNTGPTRVVQARLSKTDSDTAFETAESITLDHAATEAAQLAIQKQAAVADYLKHAQNDIEVGACVVIPTTTDDPMIYTKSNLNYATNGTADNYKIELFGDEFEDQSELETPLNQSPAKKEDTTDMVAGGLESAFAPGKTVLEIGGGQAIAAHELGQMFPETTIIVTDIDYVEPRPVQPGQPGVQLTRSDWNNLKEIPDNSIDTIISTLGVFLWGRNQASYLDAITRVAKEGAVLRFAMTDTTNADRGDLLLLAARGWRISVSGLTVIAIKMKGLAA